MLRTPSIAALLHDDAGAEKADAGYDVGDDLRGAGVAVEMHSDIDEGRRADGDQHVRAQTAAALPVLPLGTNQTAKDEGSEQVDERVEEVIESEGIEEGHDRPSS